MVPGGQAGVAGQLLVDVGQEEPAGDRPAEYALYSSSHYFSAP